MRHLENGHKCAIEYMHAVLQLTSIYSRPLFKETYSYLEAQLNPRHRWLMSVTWMTNPPPPSPTLTPQPTASNPPTSLTSPHHDGASTICYYLNRSSGERIDTMCQNWTGVEEYCNNVMAPFQPKGEYSELGVSVLGTVEGSDLNLGWKHSRVIWTLAQITLEWIFKELTWACNTWRLGPSRHESRFCSHSSGCPSLSCHTILFCSFYFWQQFKLNCLHYLASGIVSLLCWLLK